MVPESVTPVFHHTHTHTHTKWTVTHIMLPYIERESFEEKHFLESLTDGVQKGFLVKGGCMSCVGECTT